MEKNKLFQISRRNTEWLKDNYENLKTKYDNCWVLIRDRKVVGNASSFDEIMIDVKKHDPNEILVEYIQTEPVAMFF